VNVKKPLTVLGLGALLAFSFAPYASALTTADGTATITWPGYDANFVDGSTPAPNSDPVVVQVDFAQPFSGKLLNYVQFPGLPNPAFWSVQNDAFLTGSGQCIDPPSNTLIATVTTVPAIDYEAYKCYFFDGSSADVGFGLYFGPDVTNVTSVTVTFHPGSIAQVSKETLAFGVDNLGIDFRDFEMLIPALEPEPTTQPAKDLAKTGVSHVQTLLVASGALGALVLGGVLAFFGRRRWFEA
jgi:LPXTG-motif cell wall-anchored protein